MSTQGNPQCWGPSLSQGATLTGSGLGPVAPSRRSPMFCLGGSLTGLGPRLPGFTQFSPCTWHPLRVFTPTSEPLPRAAHGTGAWGQGHSPVQREGHCQAGRGLNKEGDQPPTARPGQRSGARQRQTSHGSVPRLAAAAAGSPHRVGRFSLLPGTTRQCLCARGTLRREEQTDGRPGGASSVVLLPSSSGAPPCPAWPEAQQPPPPPRFQSHSGREMFMEQMALPRAWEWAGWAPWLQRTLGASTGHSSSASGHPGTKEPQAGGLWAW